MILRTIAFVLFFGNVAFPKDFCAVLVQVRGDGGQAIRTSVELMGPEGESVAHKLTDQQGKAEFCDFGLGEHKILVGKEHCYPVLIRKVQLVYPIVQVFPVSLTACPPAPEQGPAKGGCEAYFRVVSNEGIPLAATTVTETKHGYRGRTDAYGRTLMRVPLGEGASFRFSAPGHQPQVITVKCDGLRQIEKRVMLVKRPDASQSRAAPAFCAIKLLVTDEDGSPLAVPVALINKSRETKAVILTDEYGGGRLCDFDFGVYDILVGWDSCNSVEILNVRLEYGREQEFKVSLNTPCRGRSELWGEACQVYVRVSSDKGQPVPSATITRSGSRDPYRPDSYGRTLMLVGKNETAVLTVGAPDFADTIFYQACEGRQRVEREIILKGKPK